MTTPLSASEAQLILPLSRPIAVIGGGTLGSRIALMLASGGGEVRLFDPKQEQAKIAKAYVDSELPKLVQARSGAQSGSVVVSSSMESAVAGVWMAVEAVPERLELKKSIFRDLDRLAPPDAILASNSSSYPSSQFADHVSRRSRLVNTHYYMPPQQNAVEIMSCGETAPEVIAALAERLPRYGFFPFVVRKESVGLIFNRIWAAVKRESLSVVAEGVSTPEDVDRLFQVLLGTHGGPFRLMDKVGLDVVLDIEEHYASIRTGLPTEPRELLKRYIEQGHLGVKSGQGFYADYSGPNTAKHGD